MLGALQQIAMTSWEANTSMMQGGVLLHQVI